MPDIPMPEQLTLPIEWNIPDDIVTRFATNMVVQKIDSGYLVSFFEIFPPLVLGQPNEIADQLKQLKSVHANCFARIVIADAKMTEFSNVLQAMLKQIEEINSAKEKK
jgi:hypothetical protein